MMQTSLLNPNVSEKNFIDKIRESVSFYGVEEASIRDLLAIIIGKDNIQICSQLDALTVRELMGMSQADFIQIEGIGKRTAEVLESSIALAKKLANEGLPDMFVIRSPEDAYELFKHMRHNQQEEFIVAFLDTKNQVIGKRTIFRGSLNASIVHPREVYAAAIKMRAASIICAHSHPSGNPSESKEDIEVTKRLSEAGKIIGIEMLDHVIVGDGKCISLKEKGYI